MKGQPVAQESEPSADAERADAARGMWASSKEIQSRVTGSAVEVRAALRTSGRVSGT